MTVDETIGAALRAIDDAAAEARRDAVWLTSAVTPWRTLPQVSEAEAERRSRVGAELMARIERLDLNALPAELRLTTEVARHHGSVWAREAGWWWLVCDPLRVGFFALFLPTAYAGGFLLNAIHAGLRAFAFENDGDHDRYRALLADYVRLLDQLAARTRGQAERGIRMPRAQLEQAVALIASLRDAAPAALAVDSSRLTASHRNGFATEIDRFARGEVVAAYDRLGDVFDAGYRAAAPEAVGIAQYAGGRDVYEELVRLHTTLPLSSAEIHAAGHARMERIRAEQAAVARAAGYPDAAAFEAALAADSRWRATTPEAVQALFDRAIARIEPALATAFRALPSAGVRAAPLPGEVSASMTFGYYAQPSPAESRGTYFFNAANLTRRPLPNVAALAYHELVPGHHLHIASQLENASIPELRQRTLVNAFNEGWAEYAATLAGEIGMYADPAERYGRLTMDAFLTCRLVVDTGMNAFGWTLERARAYLREHSGMSPAEIDSETIRYSCDLPAQSLAYKLGDEFFLELREEMRAQLGDRFDLRDFHAAVLNGGSLPLPLVAENVRRTLIAPSAAAS